MINLAPYFRGILPQEVLDALEREMEEADAVGSGSLSPDSVVGRTDGSVALFVDPVSGDDANEGTVSHPFQTAAKAASEMPIFVDDASSIDLTGTNTLSADLTIAKILSADLTLDGGENYTVAYGPWTADESDVAYIGNTGAPLADSTYEGYLLHIMSGAQEGYYTIQSNTTSRVYPCKNWGGAPGNVQFQIVRPTTTINGSSDIYLYGAGSEEIVLQDLYIAGSVEIIIRGTVGVTFNRVVLASGSTVKVSYYSGKSFTLQSTGILSTNTFNVSNCNAFEVYESYIKQDTVIGPDVVLTEGISRGSAVEGTSLEYNHCYSMDNDAFTNSSGYANTLAICNVVVDNGCNIGIAGGEIRGGLQINRSNVVLRTSALDINTPTPVGIDVQNGSQLDILVDVDVSNGSTHGIEANGSRINIGAVTVSGSSNVGAGIYGHSGSTVTITDGSPPTVTGTIGDISDNGIIELATWSDIDGGIEYRIANTLTIKEV